MMTACQHCGIGDGVNPRTCAAGCAWAPAPPVSVRWQDVLLAVAGVAWVLAGIAPAPFRAGAAMSVFAVVGVPMALHGVRSAAAGRLSSELMVVLGAGAVALLHLQHGFSSLAEGVWLASGSLVAAGLASALRKLASDVHAGTPAAVLDHWAGSLDVWLLRGAAVAGAVAVGAWSVFASVELGLEVGLAVVTVAAAWGGAGPLRIAAARAVRRVDRLGARVRSAAAVERLARVRLVAWDKTATLTEEAPPSLVRLRTFHGVAMDEALGLALALEDAVDHPVARALRAEATRRNIAPRAVTTRTFVPGRGVVALDEQRRDLALGSPSLMHSMGVKAQSDARVLLARGGEVIAEFDVEEGLRVQSPPALRALKQQGIGSVLLTGAGSERALRVAQNLGLPAEHEITPANAAQVLARAGITAWTGAEIAVVGRPRSPGGVRCSWPGAERAEITASELHLRVADPSVLPRLLHEIRRAVERGQLLVTGSLAIAAALMFLAGLGVLGIASAGAGMLAVTVATLLFAAKA